jgi:hypothetical protein
MPLAKIINNNWDTKKSIGMPATLTRNASKEGTQDFKFRKE